MRRISILFIALLLVLIAPAGLLAQTGGSLAYGSAQVGTISPASPLVFYSFPAAAGDLIAVDVIALTPGFDPSVSLLSPAQQQVAANDNHPLVAGTLDAHLSRRLDAPGTYALLVGGVSNSTGDFLIKLNGQAASAAIPFTPGLTADFAFNPQPQIISVPTDPGAPTPLTLTASPASFGFSARVFAADGAFVGAVTGLPQVTLSLPAGAGSALVVLQPASPEALGAVQVATSGSPASSGSSGSPVSTATLVPSGSQNTGGVAPANICTVTSVSNVNLRSGPGTNFGQVGTLFAGIFLPVVGVSPDRTWYAVNFNGQQVWVSSTVVVLNGPCGNLAVIQPPSAPATQPGAPTQAQPTLGVVVTESVEPGPDQEAPTQAVSPTAPPTTVPPTAAPVAPPDSDHQVALDRNAGGSFSQVISYPDGDRTDRIIVSVSNFDSINTFAQFTVALVCSGSGTEHVRWGENQNANLACGNNLTLTLTNESNTRFLNVTLPSGPAYVNYTLVFVRVS